MTRTILVTGSANGIGAAAATHLRAQGHIVIGLDLSGAEIAADLCTVDGRNTAVAEAILQSGGHIDAVIACAGLASADTDAMIGVNYFGTVALIDGLRETLSKVSAPRVVAITSSATILPSDPGLIEACLAGDEATATAIGRNDPALAYASTKHALSRWIRRTAKLPAWAGQGILLNAVAPGTILTGMTAPILATAEGREMLEQMTPIAVNAYAPPEDIVPLLAFLAGAECRYMVGQVIFIDGGNDAIHRGDDIF